jgi:hypothetical protein
MKSNLRWAGLLKSKRRTWASFCFFVQGPQNSETALVVQCKLVVPRRWSISQHLLEHGQRRRSCYGAWSQVVGAYDALVFFHESKLA